MFHGDVQAGYRNSSFSHYHAGGKHLSLHMFIEIYLNLLFQSLVSREGTSSFTSFVFVWVIHGPDQWISLMLTQKLTGITIFQTPFLMFPLVILILESCQNHTKLALYDNLRDINSLTISSCTLRCSAFLFGSLLLGEETANSFQIYNYEVNIFYTVHFAFGPTSPFCDDKGFLKTFFMSFLQTYPQLLILSFPWCRQRST